MSEPSFLTALKILAGGLGLNANLPLRAFNGIFPHHPKLEPLHLKPSKHIPEEIAGVYEISDLYCQDPSCDCRKVSLIFYKNKKVWATVAYGWKSEAFYRRWGLDKSASHSLAKGFLDTFSHQSEVSPIFLKAFLLTLKKDPKFIASLKARYALFKKTIDENPHLIEDFDPVDELPENVVPLNRYRR